MSAPFKFDLEAATPLGKDTPVGDVFAITARDRRFCRDEMPGRWWLNGDPVATAWHNALSIAFPKGEAFFIEHVRACREGAPAKLDAEIRAFVRQEVNHTREHIAFNRAVTDAGYDIFAIEQRLEKRLSLSRNRSSVANLAASMALEHLTAIMARETLLKPEQFDGTNSDAAELWRWHAVEEIEHKGVAYDTWLHATRDWSPFKRWRIKSLLMVMAGQAFLVGRICDTLDLLAQDGLKGWKWKWRLAKYLLGKPGVVRCTLPRVIAYFLPGFHPWNTDDRSLILLYDSEFPDAVQPAR